MNLTEEISRRKIDQYIKLSPLFLIFSSFFISVTISYRIQDSKVKPSINLLGVRARETPIKDRTVNEFYDFIF